MNKIVVFDFDKTLTHKDTLLGYLIFCAKKNVFFYPKVVLYIALSILSKLKFISNSSLKNYGAILFLKNLHKRDIEEKSTNFSKKIIFNNVYYNYFLCKHPNAIIISASLHEYLKYVFPNNTVIASNLSYDDKGYVNGILLNCYKHHKVTYLKENGFSQIDIFYTDSFSDKPLMDVSQNVFLVKGDSIKKIK